MLWQYPVDLIRSLTEHHFLSRYLGQAGPDDCSSMSGKTVADALRLMKKLIKS
jgi:hypothetical protein